MFQENLEEQRVLYECEEWSVESGIISKAILNKCDSDSYCKNSTFHSVLDFFHAPKVSPFELCSAGSILSLSGTNAVQKSASLSTLKGFTLAEALITLAVIGVVAAITMPVLIANINDRVNFERQANIAYKVTQAMEQMRAHGKLVQYGSTEKFVDELQKYLKIQKRCSANNIAECWPTETVIDGQGEEYTVSDAQKRKNLLPNTTTGNKNDNNVGLILADGASLILTYNKDAEPIDIGEKVTAVTIKNPKGQDIAYSITPTTASIDFIMDVNGKRKPNKEGKDIKSFSVATFTKSGHACDDGPQGCLYLVPTYTYVNCNRTDSNVTSTAEYQKYCGSGCEDTNNWNVNCTKDYWAGAKKACEEAGMTLPNIQKLQDIYAVRSSYTGLNANIASNTGYFWSSEERPALPQYDSRIVCFDGGFADAFTKTTYYQVLCVEK